MTHSTASPVRAKYGLDAPGAIAGLLLLGVCGLAVWCGTWLGFWSGCMFGMPLDRVALGCGAGFLLGGLGWFWYSKFGKLRTRERLLGLIEWRGDERVLDAGCGRGLMLIGAARRLTTGRAIGIDIWSARDQSGNSAEATLENARREGVSNRVEVRTADVRSLPFPDEVFEVVISHLVIHNLASAKDRAQAIGEIARVLKPAGLALIADIRHGTAYAARFVECGCGDIRRIGSPLASILVGMCTFGVVRPVTLLVRKTGDSRPTR